MSVLPKLGKLVSSRTALFVCDIQEKFRPHIQHFDAIVSVSSRLIAAAKMVNMPILVTEMYPKGLGKSVPELGDLSGVPIIPKMAFSMVTEDVNAAMSKFGRHIDSVILCGLETHVCVHRTTLDLLERGINVHCIADAISSRSMVNRILGLERLRQSGAFITTSEAVILGLVEGAGDPLFKPLQKLIKETAPSSGLFVGEK